MNVRSVAVRQIVKGKPGDFTGLVLLDQLAAPDDNSLLGATSVSFGPGARSVWHRHANRQVLFVTAGWGVLQITGEQAQLLTCGDVAEIPPEIVHWHGAACHSALTHLALLEAHGDGTTWLEPVEEVDYLRVSQDVFESNQRLRPGNIDR